MTVEERNAQLRRRVARHTLSNCVGRGLMLAIGFFLTPFLLHRLGPPHYGLWLVVGSVMAYGELFELGITGSVIKYLAEHPATLPIESSPATLAAFGSAIGSSDYAAHEIASLNTSPIPPAPQPAATGRFRIPFSRLRS